MAKYLRNIRKPFYETEIHQRQSNNQKVIDMSEDSRQQLRQNAVLSADKFSTMTFADRVEKLYENVCELREMVLRAC